MRPAAAALLVALTACSPAGTPPPPACSAPMLSETNAAIGLTGVEVTLSFSFQTFCDPPASAESSVLDPTSLTVPSTARMDAYVGTVKFTPTVSGPHHIAVRFQPNRGLAQADVLVARDRNQEPGLELVDLPSPDGLELLDAGFLVQAADVWFPSAGHAIRVQTLPGPARPAGDVLWVYRSSTSRLERMVIGTLADGGTGYVLSHDTGYTFVPDSVYPTEMDAVVTSLGSIRHITVTAGGGFEVRTINTTFSGPQHRVMNQLITLEGSRECVLDLDGNGSRVCADAPSGPDYYGGDITGFWAVYDPNELAFHGPGFGVQSSITLPPAAFPRKLGVAPRIIPVMRLDSRDLVAALENGRVGLEWWGGEVLSASMTTVVTRTNAGVLVRRR